jgi:urea carboxylase
MEGPGGYQFVGRTVPVWNRYKQTADFVQPWLLRFFDQIRFFPVSPEELLRYREAVIQGKVKLEIQEEVFCLGEYHRFLQEQAQPIADFRAHQRAAFAAERERWATAGEFTQQAAFEAAQLATPETPVITLPPEQEAVVAHVSASVWQVVVQSGQVVAEGECLVILEAMKMELAICAEQAGTIAEIFCQPGQSVTAGQLLVAVVPG